MGIREDAYAAIPNYSRTVAGAALAKKYRHGDPNRNVRSVDRVMAEIIARAGDLIAAGEDIPVEFGERIEAAERADRAMELRSIAVRQASELLRVDLDEVVQDGYEPAFAFLGEQLQALVAEVQQIAPAVAGIRDTYEAQQQGNSHWARLVHLTSVYDEIRSTQVEILNTVDTADRINRAHRFTFGLFADAHDVSPYWQRLRSNAVRNSNPQSDLARAYVAWLNDDKRTNVTPSMWEGSSDDVTPSLAWWGSGDRAIELLWVATNTHPWIPTADVMNAAHDAAVGAVTRVERIPTPHQLDNRARLYKLTEQRDRHPAIPSVGGRADNLDASYEDIMRKSAVAAAKHSKAIEDARFQAHVEASRVPGLGQEQD